MQTTVESTASLPAQLTTVEVRVLRSVVELEEVRSQWRSWPGNRDSDMEFYLTVLRESPETLRPHVVVVSRDGKPDAILVGRLDNTRLDRVRIGYVRVRPRVKQLYFVYGALRGNVSPENCELVIHEVYKSLHRGEADLAYLNFLRIDSDIHRLARRVPGVLYRDRIGSSQRHFTGTIPRTVEELHKRLSPKVRKNQRWNKMNRDFPGAVRIRCFKTVSEIDELAEVAEDVARHSYQRGLGVGFVNTHEERRRLRLKAEKGWLRAYVLFIGDKPAAFWIGDINERVFGSDYLGFDPAFSKYSPGMYLILKVIEGLCGSIENVNEVDFATGRAEYKEALSNRVWDEGDVFIFAPTFKGVVLNAVKTSALAIDHVLRRILDHAGLLQKIKKSWRERLSSHHQAAE